jgi:threonine dehydratase
VATLSLEMMEQVPDLEVVIAPIGGGSGACAHCIAGKAINPRLEVIGVQAEGAPAVWRAFHHGDRAPGGPIATFAEGLATRVAFDLPLRILKERLDDLVLVSDDELRAAMVCLIETTRQLAEGAGAAATAAAFKLRDRLAGRKVGLVLSGGNVTVDGLRDVLAR